MFLRILLLPFVSIVTGFCYLMGLARVMTGLLLGFSSCSAVFWGVVFSLPMNADRLWLPVYERVPAWPYFLLALLLFGLIVIHFFKRHISARPEAVTSRHVKYLLGGLACYAVSMFVSSIYWFPADAYRLSADPQQLKYEVLFGAVMFIAGITVSCWLFWRASMGGTDKQPDLMRRLVLAVFALFQLDKMPLLVTYLLVYAPQTGIIFPHIAVLALSATIPIGFFLLKTTNDFLES